MHSGRVQRGRRDCDRSWSASARRASVSRRAALDARQLAPPRALARRVPLHISHHRICAGAYVRTRAAGVSTSSADWRSASTRRRAQRRVRQPASRAASRAARRAVWRAARRAARRALKWAGAGAALPGRRAGARVRASSPATCTGGGATRPYLSSMPYTNPFRWEGSRLCPRLATHAQVQRSGALGGAAMHAAERRFVLQPQSLWRVLAIVSTGAARRDAPSTEAVWGSRPFAGKKVL